MFTDRSLLKTVTNYDVKPVKVEKIDGLVRKYKGKMRLITAKESGFAIKTSSLIQDNMIKDIENAVQDILGVMDTDEK